MFKKAIKIGAQNQLSGKDRKNIKSKLSSQFHAPSVEAIVANNQKINCNKVSGSKVLVYMGDKFPLFVDGTGKEDFFPTVYLCSAYQTLLPSIFLNEGVQSYIFNGANLMWPGVRDFSSLLNFKKDQVVAIRDCKGIIIAIGAMGCSLDELKKNSDGSGVAVFTLHYKGDKLWDMGTKQYPDVVMQADAPKKEEEVKKQEEKPEDVEKVQEAPENAEKVKKKDKKSKEEKPKAKEEKLQKPESEEDYDSDQDSEQGQLDLAAMIHSKKVAIPQVQYEKKKVAKFSDDEEDNRKGKKKGGKKAAKVKQQSEEEQIPIKQKHKQSYDFEEDDKKKQKGKKGKGKKKQIQESDQEKPQPQKKQTKKKKQEQSEEQEEQKQEKSVISSQLMDQYFKQAFLNALKLSKIELPIDSGRFFSDYMVFARSDDTQLSVKDSSFKKLGRFYEQMAKLKYIEFKPVKEKKGQSGSTITKILWENEELKNYMPTIRKLGEKEVQEKQEIFSKEKLVLSKTMNVEVVYKLNKELEDILIPKKKVNYMPDNSDEQEQENTKKQKQIFFSQRELKEKIEKYINQCSLKQKQQKEKKEKERKVDKIVTLSYKDNQFIHKLLKNQIEEYQDNLEKEQMMMEHDSDEEEGKKKGKKDKQRQNLFRIERGFITNKMVKLAHPYYKLSDQATGLSKFREGTFKGIQIITDKVMNKNVTKIIGLETFIPPTFKEDEVVKQIHGFSHHLQVKFASSSTVQNLPGKNAGREVVIQGNFVDELEGLFMTEYSIKKECITIQNKLGKKKKK